jgi:hypothetical protein
LLGVDVGEIILRVIVNAEQVPKKVNAIADEMKRRVRLVVLIILLVATMTMSLFNFDVLPYYSVKIDKVYKKLLCCI